MGGKKKRRRWRRRKRRERRRPGKKKSEKGRCSSDGAEGTGVKERGKVWREKEARKKKEQMK